MIFLNKLQPKLNANRILKICNPWVIQDYFLSAIIKRSLRMRPPKFFYPSKAHVLAICCYMADRPNLVPQLVQSVKEAKQTKIDLIISNNSKMSSSEAVQSYVLYNMTENPKYRCVDRIIREQVKPHHNYIMIIDDDVGLPNDFFDNYFKIVRALGLILSQPALTEDSHSSHPVSRQIHGAVAHLTSFIEIGPISCFEKRLVNVFSFSGGSPMGWGLDYAWSRLCRDRRWPMGVVDLTPVKHNLRSVGLLYNRAQEYALMMPYLRKTPHVPFCAKRIIGQVFSEKDFEN
jgi:hypothetical protein